MNPAISAFLSILDKLMPSREERRIKRIINEDISLYQAITRGDMEEVERIRQRKQRYSNAVKLLTILLLSGCVSNYKNIPIVGDNVPIKLKVGSPVILANGTTNIVQAHKDTLVSDAYIYMAVVNTTTNTSGHKKTPTKK